MEEITVGLIAAPELPESIARHLIDYLPDLLSKLVEKNIHWKTELVVDTLTGAAKDAQDIMAEAKTIKKSKGWTYAICLTDLPIYAGNNIVLADANIAAGVAQISLPSFGAFPMKKRVKRTIIQLVSEIYFGQGQDETIEMAPKGIGLLSQRKQRSLYKILVDTFQFATIRRIKPHHMDNITVRFIIIPRMNARVRILMGMTYANRPWTIMPSFKSVVAIAFGTGAYGLIFTTLWQLSVSYNMFRFLGLSVVAISSMMIWIIFSHNLWETAHDTPNRHMRILYNSTTICTLGVAVLIYYMVLFFLFLIAVSVFVPPSLYAQATGLGDHVSFSNYVRLAWLVTSVATIAGAIGAGLENGDRVRNVTYGNRQRNRYQIIKQQKESAAAQESDQ